MNHILAGKQPKGLLRQRNREHIMATFAMSDIKDKILSFETMLYTYINVHHQIDEQTMMIKPGNLFVNMQESLASCVSVSAIFGVKLTLCFSVVGLMYL